MTSHGEGRGKEGKAERERGGRGSHPAAQALLAGVMIEVGDKYGDQQMQDAGRRLAEKATSSPATDREK